MFHPSEAGRDVDIQREGSRGQAKRSFLSYLSYLEYLTSTIAAVIFHLAKGSKQTNRNGREGT